MKMIFHDSHTYLCLDETSVFYQHKDVMEIEMFFLNNLFTQKQKNREKHTAMPYLIYTWSGQGKQKS